MPRPHVPTGVTQYVRTGREHIVYNVHATSRKPIKSPIGDLYMSNGAISLLNKLNPDIVIPKSPPKSPPKSRLKKENRR